MKRLLLSVLLISIAGFSFAKKVELNDAKSVAMNAYFEKVNHYIEAVNFQDLNITEQYVINKNGEEVIYVFNFNNYGFIMIAAEDAIEPVLGYTFDSHYANGPKPEGFQGTLNEYAEHILFLRTNGIDASPEIADQWEAVRLINSGQLAPVDGSKDVEPMLTCTWNQDWPYNYYCPEDAGGPGGHVYVGCVATAMSQIMLHWRYPAQGNGSKSYYYYPYGTISANFGATTYDWDGMVDNSDSKINLPMALIGFHAGVAVEMMYAPDGSGAYSADVPYALKQYFGYSNSCLFKSRSSYPLSTWKTMANNELNDACPIYYSGQSSDGGHAFVIDGFHFSDDMYHFNFGWSGYSNGWYLITNAGGFTTYQGMIVNFFPQDSNYPYGCQPDVVYTNKVGSFEDGSSPMESYDQNANCSWLINPQNENDSIHNITLEFITLDTDPDDVITIYDGETTDAPVLGTFSGTSLPADDVTSTGNKMLITFIADGDAVTASGWKVEYSSSQSNWCGGLVTLTESSGTFDDGSADWYYTNGSNCMWKIEPQYATDITLEFTQFISEENKDIVKIYDAGNNQLLTTLSGDYTGSLPDPIFAESGKLFITFQSDGVNNFPGFIADWYISNTGVSDYFNSFADLSVYPNPADNKLNISFTLDENQSFDIKLMTISGEVVYIEHSQSFIGNYVNTIDISEMAKGVYVLNLVNEKGSTNRKVVIK